MQFAFNDLEGVRDLDKLISDFKSPFHSTPTIWVLNEHECIDIDSDSHENLLLIWPNLCISPCDWEIEYLIGRVLKIELLSVTKVRTQTLQRFTQLLVNQIHHSGCQCFEWYDLKLLFLVLIRFCYYLLLLLQLLLLLHLELMTCLNLLIYAVVIASLLLLLRCSSYSTIIVVCSCPSCASSQCGTDLGLLLLWICRNSLMFTSFMIILLLLEKFA